MEIGIPWQGFRQVTKLLQSAISTQTFMLGKQ